MNGSLHIFENIDVLYAALEKQWRLLAHAAIADHGAFYVALAGGSTPRNFYKKLAQQSAIDRACWHKTHIYFGDERCVSQDHPDSNYCMAKETLLSVVPLLPEHVHAMFSTDLSVEQNVEDYETLLHDALPLDAKEHPVFDLVLLGMGEDGHTASLFPDTEILHESVKPVAAQFVKKLNAWRMSLTFPTINAANYVVVLIAGAAKEKVLADIFSTKKNTGARYPIQQVKPAGQLDWYLDTVAAHLLNVQD